MKNEATTQNKYHIRFADIVYGTEFSEPEGGRFLKIPTYVFDLTGKEYNALDLTETRLEHALCRVGRDDLVCPILPMN